MANIKPKANYILTSRTNDGRPNPFGPSHCIGREGQLQVLCEGSKAASVYQNGVVKFFFYTFRLQKKLSKYEQFCDNT